MDPLPTTDPRVAIDPVCGMRVDPVKAVHRAEHDGTTVVFCGARCRARFVADPSAFLAPTAAKTHDEGEPAHHGCAHSHARPTPTAPPGTTWTCPMHPEVVRDAPGSCPICGMALEPTMVTAEEAPNEELVDMQRRLRVCAALAIPVFV